MYQFNILILYKQASLS